MVVLVWVNELISTDYVLEWCRSQLIKLQRKWNQHSITKMREKLILKNE